MGRKYLKGLFLGILLVGSCTSDEAHRYYAETTFPRKKVEEIEVLREAPSKAYDVIADFQARGASVKYMRKKAAEIGADAVIIGTYGGYKLRSEEWASQDAYSNSYSRIVGTAIKYKR
jgi:uncharacterized protein YbjQ (UPF0145 family)